MELSINRGPEGHFLDTPRREAKADDKKGQIAIKTVLEAISTPRPMGIVSMVALDRETELERTYQSRAMGADVSLYNFVRPEGWPCRIRR